MNLGIGDIFLTFFIYNFKVRMKKCRFFFHHLVKILHLQPAYWAFAHFLLYTLLITCNCRPLRSKDFIKKRKDTLVIFFPIGDRISRYIGQMPICQRVAMEVFMILKIIYTACCTNQPCSSQQNSACSCSNSPFLF